MIDDARVSTRGICIVALSAALGACGGTDNGPDEPAFSPWSLELPPAADSMGVRRGLSPARGIIHLHSPYSHDACDGDGRNETTGELNEDCLADLRRGLCMTRVDYAVLTEHDSYGAYDEFENLLLARGDDVLLDTTNRMTCDNGHQVLFYTGEENDLMPIMTDRHPDGTIEERAQIYDKYTPEHVDVYREIGGHVVVNHTEGWTVDDVRELAPDGIEIYNIHANIDPDIREQYLGLDKAGAITAVLEFADTSDEGPEPDLAMLSFLSPNTAALEIWDSLLGEGMRIFGTTGTDAHENVLPLELRDGERGDSYRRMIRWTTNVALVADPTDPVQIEDAVAAGRFFVAFEILGTPVGFDAVATNGSDAVEMGGEVDAGAGYTIDVQVPALYDPDPELPAPEISARILRVDATGSHELIAGDGPTVSAPIDAPGAYRVEVMITPLQHGPRLGNLGPDYAQTEHVWVYSNPIYAVAP